MQNPVFLTYREVSEIIGMNRTTISRMVRRGDFPAPIYVGANPRWHRESFESWLAELNADGDGAQSAA